jgi:hypothetical protein
VMFAKLLRAFVTAKELVSESRWYNDIEYDYLSGSCMTRTPHVQHSPACTTHASHTVRPNSEPQCKHSGSVSENQNSQGPSPSSPSSQLLFDSLRAQYFLK